MNIPFSVLRTEIAGEEDWSICVKKEHINKVPSGYKLDLYQSGIGGGGDLSYEKHYPFTDIRYFTPNRDRLDEIQCDIATGNLEHKYSCPLGDVYEGVFGLKESIEVELAAKKKLARDTRIYQMEVQRLPSPKSRQRYKISCIAKLMEEYDIVDVAKILKLSITTIKESIGVDTETREERMILANKRKRLARSQYQRGTSVLDIAEYLDVSVETVKRYLGSLYNNNRNSDGKFEKVIELMSQGYQQVQIAKMLNMNRTTVYHYIRKYGKPINYRCEKYDVKFKKKLMNMSKKSKSISRLAQMMKCNVLKVQYYLDHDK